MKLEGKIAIVTGAGKGIEKRLSRLPQKAQPLSVLQERRQTWTRRYR